MVTNPLSNTRAAYFKYISSTIDHSTLDCIAGYCPTEAFGSPSNLWNHYPFYLMNLLFYNCALLQSLNHKITTPSRRAYSNQYFDADDRLALIRVWQCRRTLCRTRIIVGLASWKLSWKCTRGITGISSYYWSCPVYGQTFIQFWIEWCRSWRRFRHY